MEVCLTLNQDLKQVAALWFLIVDTYLYFLCEKNAGIPELTSLMADFAVYHRSAPISSTPASGYKTGDLVAAKFSVDNAWYRAKVRKNFPHKKEAEVVFIDYGNSEVVPHGNIRSLDPRFKSLPPQAKEATLSFVKLLGPDTEYGSEALDRFRSLVEVC
jgi:staphylococcal nuclease domain-containing protein 1